MRVLERGITVLPYPVIDRVLFGFHPAVRPLQTIVQHLIGGPRPADFELDGHTFHCSTAEKYFFERERFEQNVWSVLQKQVALQDVVYDLGAHIGFWALRLSRVCKHVVAFEPSPTNFERLRKNVGSIQNVTLVKAAVAANEGELGFVEGGTMSVVGSGNVLVKTVTLDASAARYLRPSFLLIDVEGYAGEVLRGAAGLLAHKVPLICEIHNNQEKEATLPKLCDCGYEIARIHHRKGYPYQIFAK